MVVGMVKGVGSLFLLTKWMVVKPSPAFTAVPIATKRYMFAMLRAEALDAER